MRAAGSLPWCKTGNDSCGRGRASCEPFQPSSTAERIRFLETPNLGSTAAGVNLLQVGRPVEFQVGRQLPGQVPWLQGEQRTNLQGRRDVASLVARHLDAKLG